MAKKYEPPKPTGREYVDATKAFRKYSFLKLTVLPERWAVALLNPLIECVNRIEGLVVQANRVYIKTYKKGEHIAAQEYDVLIAAYRERASILVKALREFAEFDTGFEHLTDQIDLMYSERKRMKNIFKGMIESYQNNPSQENKMEIRVEGYLSEVHYTSMFGTERVQLGLTAKNKDYWLGLEETAITEISNRIKKDNSIIKRLEKAKALC